MTRLRLILRTLRNWFDPQPRRESWWRRDQDRRRAFRAEIEANRRREW